MLEHSNKSISGRESLLSLFPDFNEAMGSNITEAILKRKEAITRGGASAKRMKIAAKEIDSTPANRMIYGFTDYHPQSTIFFPTNR